jgi:YesN/AraC family two-component response regulator
LTIDYLSKITCEHHFSSIHSVPFHKHDTFEIYLFLGGEANFYTAKTGLHLERGTLVLIKANLFHRAETLNSNQNYERLYIHFPKEIFELLSTENTDLSEPFHHQSDIYVIKLTETQIEELVALETELETTLNQMLHGSDVRVFSLMARILLFINPSTHEQIPQNLKFMPQLLLDLFSFIENNYTKELTIQTLSDHFHMSGAYLSKYFKTQMGITFQEYVIQKRIELARLLLADGISVSDTCELTGFGNYYNFIRCFNQRVGVSPGKYKKAYLQSIGKLK